LGITAGTEEGKGSEACRTLNSDLAPSTVTGGGKKRRRPSKNPRSSCLREGTIEREKEEGVKIERVVLSAEDGVIKNEKGREGETTEHSSGDGGGGCVRRKGGGKRGALLSLSVPRRKNIICRKHRKRAPRGGAGVPCLPETKWGEKNLLGALKGGEDRSEERTKNSHKSTGVRRGGRKEEGIEVRLKVT